MVSRNTFDMNKANFDHFWSRYKTYQKGGSCQTCCIYTSIGMQFFNTLIKIGSSYAKTQQQTPKLISRSIL